MTEEELYNIDDILARIREAWVQTPGLRFGQLVVNLIKPDAACPGIFYIKNRDLRGRITEWMTKISEINKTEI